MTEATPSLPRKPHALLVAFAWLVASSAALGMGFAWLLPDIGDRGRIVEPLNWLAFCGRTFGLHIGLGLVLVLLLMLLRRLWKPAILTSLIAIWCLWPTLWSLRPRSAPPALAPSSLSVYSVNAQVGAVDPTQLQAQIESFDADIVIIQEHNPRVQAILPALRTRYAHIAQSARDDAFGMAILSKLPFTKEPESYPNLGIILTEPQLRVVVQVNNQELVIQGVHTLPPVSFSYLREQRRVIRALATWAKQEQRPTIIAGDFNCTPESMAMGWLREAGLADAWTTLNLGPGATWPVDAGLFSLMGVKIDHLLLSKSLAAAHAELGSSIGSDHRAIYARVNIGK
jgi:endonuclease/exonuclease/phosphatase (EEP) superfamily protein YafD